MTIIFYDIPSTALGSAWSPNTWKVRYALNYKNIPYKTEWVEYPDIQSHCEKLGIQPTSVYKDGRLPLYTLPAIHDPSTGVSMADSQPIIEYLEKTYPDAPTLFPHNTLALQAAFNDAFNHTLDAQFQFILPAVCLKLNPPSEEFFRRTREKRFGKKLEDVVPQGEARAVEWAKVKADFAKVDVWYSKNTGTGPFLMGNVLTLADLAVAGYTVWLKIIWGEDSELWKDIETWHNGRWKHLINALKKYDAVV